MRIQQPIRINATSRRSGFTEPYCITFLVPERYPVNRDDAMNIYREMLSDWFNPHKCRDYKHGEPTAKNVRLRLLALGRERLGKNIVIREVQS